jgi:hypothetical protein
LLYAIKEKNKFMGSIVTSTNVKLLYTKAIGSFDIESLKIAESYIRYKKGSVLQMFTSCVIMEAF